MANLSVAEKVIGALALRGDAYRAIARGRSDTVTALAAVVVATALCGLGGLFWTYWGFNTGALSVTVDRARFIRHSVLQGGLIQVGMWLVWVGATYMYLRSFGESVSLLALARVMGFAFLPMGIQILISPPGMELAAGAVALGYTVAATTIAVQVAASTTPGRALVSVIAGFALFALALSLLGNGEGDRAPGIFALDPLPVSVGTMPVRR